MYKRQTEGFASEEDAELRAAIAGVGGRSGFTAAEASVAGAGRSEVKRRRKMPTGQDLREPALGEGNGGDGDVRPRGLVFRCDMLQKEVMVPDKNAHGSFVRRWRTMSCADLDDYEALVRQQVIGRRFGVAKKCCFCGRLLPMQALCATVLTGGGVMRGSCKHATCQWQIGVIALETWS